MFPSHTLLRGVLLGSVVAIAALAPATGADATRSDFKRLQALYGNRGAAAHAMTRSAFGAVSTDGTYTILHRFTGRKKDGCNPGAKVTFDAAGNMYGTTDFCDQYGDGDGVVFKLAPDGTYTVLHFFTGDTDGAQPDGAVTLLRNGDLVGTTTSGGANGNGTIFQLNGKGKLKVLHAFTADEGSEARGNLYRDKAGNYYGTALFGGADSSGTLFKYGADGTMTVLHTFTGGADGEFPEHGVVADKAGNLYGVTAFGGANGEGSVFKYDTAGNFSTVYSFTGGNDGSFVYGGLAIDGDGTLYGSTGDGGANNSGTVFKLTTDGALTTLYAFTGGTDGASPEGDMLLVGKNLYSTANAGGDPTCQCGVVYEITAKGKEKVLHTFTGVDGSGYSAGLVRNNGTFYGTVQYGAIQQQGAVYSLTKK
ncbi:MAG TPA: choice-of-anchor tandem repeat GloVer-containing protein [Rhizomicrobium sp.]|nr:choice-of-anchor tandem repeat GloVer-containing protein [Rhizomicrobium sp.]